MMLIIISDYSFAQLNRPVSDNTWKVDTTPKTQLKHKKRGTIAAEPDSIAIIGPNSEKIKISMEFFKEHAIQKTREFTNYVARIVNPGTTDDQAEKCIDQVCKLFVSEKDSVQVSNVDTKRKHKYTVRDYLNRLKLSLSHYSQIQVDFFDIVYVPEFRQGVDGNYYSKTIYSEKISCFSNEIIVYGDFERRGVTVVLKSHIKEKEGNETLKLDVFLSDISIVETKKIRLPE